MTTTQQQPSREAPGSRLGAQIFELVILAGEGALVLATGAATLVLAAAAGFAVTLPATAAMAVCYVLLIAAGGAIARPPRRTRQRPARRLLLAVFVVALILSPDALAAGPWLIVWFALAATAIGGWRSSAMRLARTVPPLTPPQRAMAFIGNSEASARLLQQIEADPFARLRPVGFFDDRTARTGPLNERLPYLGTIDELVSYIHDNELNDVFLALPWSAGERISELIQRLRFLPMTVRLIPDHTPPALRQRNVHQMEGVVMPTLMVPPFSAAGAFAKRTLDLAVAVALMIPLTPLFLLVAMAIRLDSKGPVFFLQRRSGQFGRGFDIYKFRSLHVAHADAAAETLVVHGDNRVTRVGHYLRKYSIDELPQILNVLFGQMSLVGPRPHVPRAKADNRIYAEVLPDYMLRYRVKPGMTGWAQVNGWRGSTDTQEKLRKRVQFDFEYITSWSFLWDLQILLRTVPSVMAPPLDNV